MKTLLALAEVADPAVRARIALDAMRDRPPTISELIAGLERASGLRWLL